jgi:hypothetical protein
MCTCLSQPLNAPAVGGYDWPMVAGADSMDGATVYTLHNIELMSVMSAISTILAVADMSAWTSTIDDDDVIHVIHDDCHAGGAPPVVVSSFQ